MLISLDKNGLKCDLISWRWKTSDVPRNKPVSQGGVDPWEDLAVEDGVRDARFGFATVATSDLGCKILKTLKARVVYLAMYGELHLN